MIRLEVARPAAFEGVDGIVADAFEDLARRIQGMPVIQGYAIGDADLPVRVVLGGARECRRWNVTAKALGFHAVCTRMRTDRRTGEGYRVLADAFEVHVNVAAHSKLLDEDWAEGGRDWRQAELVAAVVTLPHEVLHALEWARETGGLTPDAVYERDGEDGIRRVRASMEARLSANALDGEDAVESAARRIVWDVRPFDWLDQTLDALETALTAATPRP